MESTTIELNSEWQQLLNNQKGTILAPTQQLPKDRWLGKTETIGSVMIAIGDTITENNADNNSTVMPNEAISFNIESSVWVKANYGNPLMGVIK